MARWALKAVFCFLALVFSTQGRAAESKVIICNEGDTTIQVAYVHKDGWGGWVSGGWLNIPPGRSPTGGCASIGETGLSSDEYYLAFWQLNSDEKAGYAAYDVHKKTYQSVDGRKVGEQMEIYPRRGKGGVRDLGGVGRGFHGSIAKIMCVAPDVFEKRGKSLKGFEVCRPGETKALYSLHLFTPLHGGFFDENQYKLHVHSSRRQLIFPDVDEPGLQTSDELRVKPPAAERKPPAKSIDRQRRPAWLQCFAAAAVGKSGEPCALTSSHPVITDPVPFYSPQTTASSRYSLYVRDIGMYCPRDIVRRDGSDFCNLGTLTVEWQGKNGGVLTAESPNGSPADTLSGIRIYPSKIGSFFAGDALAIGNNKDGWLHLGYQIIMTSADKQFPIGSVEIIFPQCNAVIKANEFVIEKNVDIPFIPSGRHPCEIGNRFHLEAIHSMMDLYVSEVDNSKNETPQVAAILRPEY